MPTFLRGKKGKTMITDKPLRAGEREELNDKTGLRCDIYRCDFHKGGTLRKFAEVTLMIGGPVTPTPDAPAVKLVRRQPCGSDYLHVEPIDAPTSNQVGYMAGGTFIHTSDGRFPSKQPLSLHDHTEIPGLYND